TWRLRGADSFAIGCAQGDVRANTPAADATAQSPGGEAAHPRSGRTRNVKALKLLMTAAAVSAIALTGTAMAQDKGLIAVAMPNESSLRWISDGNELQSALEAKGYTVDLQYAEDDIATQYAQIENVLTKSPKALVIASIDGTTLTTVLQSAADAGAKVIAYDRLIRQSP